MQQFVFKPKRKVDGKTIIQRTYCGRYKLDGDKRLKQVSLGVTDKRVAETKLNEIVLQKQRKRAGIKSSGDGKDLIKSSVQLFCKDLRVRGRGDKYINDVERFIRIVSEHAKWDTLIDINPEGFLNWRIANGDKAPKTLNEYLNSLNAFLNWLVDRGTIEINPLLKVPRAETRGKQRRKRRSLTEKQFKRLIESSPYERSIVYHVAAYTGLRRSELKSITWNDINLEGEFPYIVVRDCISKNKITQSVPLHPDLVTRLKDKRQGSGINDHVLQVPSRLYLYKKDLEAVGIPFKDEEGRQVDFHALRTTFATFLHSNGANQAVAMQAMRHSDPRLTAITYNDANLMPVGDAISKLPSIKTNSNYSPIDSPKMFSGCQNVSKDDSQDLRKNLGKDSDSEAESPEKTAFGAKSKISAMAPAVGFEPTT